MKENKIVELKEKILSDNIMFLDIITNIMVYNKILYSDNFGNLSPEESSAFEYLEPFMHLLYRGSKHSVGNMCESGFSRVILHNNMVLKFTYYNGPDVFVCIEKLSSSNGIKRVVTLNLLKERLQESEDVKHELAPIIEKYLKAGLTFEEITHMFVEIMRENRINL